jgi:hypothetical protein
MNPHAIRRAVLQTLLDMEPAAMELGDLVTHPRFDRLGVERDALLRECRGLEAHGLLLDLRPTRSPAWRLTDTGRDQMTGDAKRAEYVWGLLAH